MGDIVDNGEDHTQWQALFHGVNGIIDRMLFVPLMGNHETVFTAHLHTYRNRGHIKNFQRDNQGPRYILTGVAGNVRYPGLWIDHQLDEVVAPQPETDNYLTMKVTDKEITVKCFLPDGQEIDEVKVKK